MAMLLISVGAWITYMVRLAYREKEKARDRAMAPGQVQLEQRVRVLEQIVTDSGVLTAARIDALREPAQRDAPADQ